MKFSFIAIVAAFGVSAAFAGTTQLPAQTISFNDLKRACQDPGAFHNQIAPANIQVACKDVATRWVPAGEGAVAMGNTRYVTTAVQSDKYTVGASTEAVAAEGQAGACPKFKQVAESVAVNRAVSCEEVVAFPGTGTEFCTLVLNELRTVNPDAIVVADTGKTVDLCAAAPAEKPAPIENKPGRGQR